VKLLFVTPFYKPAFIYGGPTRSLPALCEALVAEGSEVSVYTTDAKGSGSLDIPLGIAQDVKGVKVHFYRRVWGGNYYFAPDLIKACYNNVGKFDLMYIYSTWTYPFVPCCRAAHRAAVPYVVSPRTSFMRETWKGKQLKKWAYHFLVERHWITKASALHYTTNLELRESEWLGLRTPFFIVPNPVDQTEFSCLPARGVFRAAQNIAADAKVVLYLGRIEPRKGLDLTLAAFAQASSREPRAFLVLAGPEEENYGAILKQIVAQLGIVDRVIFTGYLDAETRLKALVDADLFVLTSYSENFGMAVVEAMAAGLPVILSDMVGIAEDVREEQAGIVVPLSVEEIARKMSEVLSSEELRRDLSRKAIRVARERFSPMKVADIMLGELGKIVGKCSTNACTNC